MDPAELRILVISGHQQALLHAVDALRSDLRGCCVRAAATLARGREEVTRQAPDIVFVLAQDGLLDPSLEFCRWLRRSTAEERVALVLVYPSKDVEDWRRLYEAEGDVYIAWDGDFVAGLASCVRSLAGRRYRMVAAPLAAGPVQLFPSGLLARIGARQIAFTPREFRILEHLVRHADRTVTVEELARVLRSEGGLREPLGRLRGRVYQFMLQIRKKLGADAEVIRTVRGVGYCIDVAYQPASD